MTRLILKDMASEFLRDHAEDAEAILAYMKTRGYSLSAKDATMAWHYYSADRFGKVWLQTKYLPIGWNQNGGVEGRLLAYLEAVDYAKIHLGVVG